MKKILILGMSLNVGGAEKSLVNFLNMIDYRQYAVDLLLFQRKGAFLKQIPENVNLLEVHEIRVLFQSASDTFRMRGKKNKDIYLTLLRYFATLAEKIRWKQFDQVRLHRWIDHYQKAIPQLEGEYDLAVAYAGGETAYYMIDKVRAKRKVYFFHSDYSQIDIDSELEWRYVQQADAVITVSEKCRESLVRLFPMKAAEIHVLQNLSSDKLIKELSGQYTPREFEGHKGAWKLVSIGRLQPPKGFDMAVEAASLLKRNGLTFVWVIIGEGEERANLEKQIDHFGLQEQVLLIGLRENPYPYLAGADLLLQTSRFEGKSVVLDEARILNKPAVITNYSSAADQIENGVNGLIVEMSAEGIANGILELAASPERITEMKEKIVQDAAVGDIENYMRVLFGEL